LALLPTSKNRLRFDLQPTKFNKTRRILKFPADYTMEIISGVTATRTQNIVRMMQRRQSAMVTTRTNKIVTLESIHATKGAVANPLKQQLAVKAVADQGTH
jgi:putative lipoic acid-binding regulatory protein